MSPPSQGGAQLFTASGVDLLYGPGAWVPAVSKEEQAKRDAANETVLGEFFRELGDAQHAVAQVTATSQPLC